MIEAEMQRILAEDFGFVGVRVTFSHDGPQVVCDPDLPKDILGRAFAAAVKAAAIKFVRGAGGP